ALGHELEFDLAGAVEPVEDPRVALAGEGAHDLAHGPRVEQGGEARVAVAGVVVDDREVTRPAGDERVDEFARLTGATEAADHDGGAVGDVGDGARDVAVPLVDHVSPPPMFAVRTYVRLANSLASAATRVEAAVPRWAHGELDLRRAGARAHR